MFISKNVLSFKFCFIYSNLVFGRCKNVQNYALIKAARLILQIYMLYMHVQGVQKFSFIYKICFSILPPLPRQHWAAYGCTVNGQPIRVTVHTQIAYQMSCSPACRGWVAVNIRKNTIFNILDYILLQSVR